METQRALVTGASSSLVQDCAKALCSVGFKVLATSSRLDRKALTGHIRMDLLNPNTWDHNELHLPFDFVFHAAAHGPSINNKDFYEVNYKAPLNFFSRINLNPDCKFVFASTSSIYGTLNRQQVTEKTIPNPENDYAKSKLYFENTIANVLKQIGSRGHLLILRIPTLLGRRVSQNIIDRWIYQSKLREKTLVYNPDKTFSSLISEIDVISRIISETHSDKTEKYIVNCYTNGDLTYLQAANLIAETFEGPKPSIVKTNLQPALSMINLGESWFDKISTRSSLTSHLKTFLATGRS
jgi:nucleoside-diphosphate-sugar epimerase